MGGGHGAHFLQAIFRELPPLCPIIGSDEGRHILDEGGWKPKTSQREARKRKNGREFLSCLGDERQIRMSNSKVVLHEYCKGFNLL